MASIKDWARGAEPAAPTEASASGTRPAGYVEALEARLAKLEALVAGKPAGATLTPPAPGKPPKFEVPEAARAQAASTPLAQLVAAEKLGKAARAGNGSHAEAAEAFRRAASAHRDGLSGADAQVRASMIKRANEADRQATEHEKLAAG